MTLGKASVQEVSLKRQGGEDPFAQFHIVSCIMDVPSIDEWVVVCSLCERGGDREKE